ncbi:hypothetical protein [Niastella populi]|nr:hypothetical protein [Niastella populi]
MRFFVIIAAILLFAEYSNLNQLFNVAEMETVLFCEEAESEEENKQEKDNKKCKFDKHFYYFDYSGLLISIAEQKQSFHRSGLCLKGHCALIDQPPEA